MNALSAAARRAQASLRELLDRTFCEIFCMLAPDSFLVITRLSHAAGITFCPRASVCYFSPSDSKWMPSDFDWGVVRVCATVNANDLSNHYGPDQNGP